MTTLANSPKLIKGGLVLIDAETACVLRVISLGYNADSLTRKPQSQEADGESGSRVEPTRFKGPAVETITLEAEIDATDQLEFPDQGPNAGELGIQAQFALLESLVHPTMPAETRAGELPPASFLGGSLRLHC
jgi:hypothetical protein